MLEFSLALLGIFVLYLFFSMFSKNDKSNEAIKTDYFPQPKSNTRELNQNTMEIPVKFTVTSSYEQKKPQQANNAEHDYDNYEGTFYGGVNSEIPYAHEYRIIYEDGKGKKTERDITTIKIGEDFDDDIMILAYCHMRDAKRSFYATRMIELIDLETGEVIKDKRAYLRNKIKEYMDSPEYLLMLKEQERLKYQYDFIQKNKDLLDIMSYIVRVDGSYNQKEKLFVRYYLKLSEITDILDDDMVDSIMKNFGLITYQSFQAKVRKLQDKNAFKFDLLDFAKEIVATQKTSTDAEDQIISYLEKRKEKMLNT